MAQEKLASVLQANPTYKFVRLGVRGGGCSGFEYSIGLVEASEEGWTEYPFEDCIIVVDPVSLMYLENVEIDYIESLTESGFKFHNPQVRSQCGCGKSFSV